MGHTVSLEEKRGVVCDLGCHMGKMGVPGKGELRAMMLAHHVNVIKLEYYTDCLNHPDLVVPCARVYPRLRRY